MKLIAAKMLAIMKESGYVQKDGYNSYQKYKYLSEAGAIEAIRPLMVKHGVIAVPSVKSFEVVPVDKTKNGTAQYMTTVLVDYEFIDAESGESVTATVLGQGIDSGDKGAYKAATGANKYCLMKTFQLATGDDPEKEEAPQPKGVDDMAAPELVEKIKKAEASLLESGAFNHQKHVTSARLLQTNIGVEDFDEFTPVNRLKAYFEYLIKKHKEHKETK